MIVSIPAVFAVPCTVQCLQCHTVPYSACKALLEVTPQHDKEFDEIKNIKKLYHVELRRFGCYETIMSIIGPGEPELAENTWPVSLAVLLIIYAMQALCYLVMALGRQI